jgi:Fur family ferric uptake transcriptional regulator
MERAQATLAAAGHKRGGARRAVLELLGRESCALSALEIEQALGGQQALGRQEALGGQQALGEAQVRRGEPSRAVSRASVYRILDELERLGLVQRVEIGQAMVRYERVCEQEEHHHHLLCDRCGLLMPFSDASLERAIASLSERVPLAVSEHEIVLRGACRECSDA